MENKEILLPSKRYFKADEQDLNLNVKLENDEVLLREGDMDVILNQADLFDTERNKSTQYKIYGKIKMIFRNMYSGYTDYTPLARNLYLNGDGSDGNFLGYVPYNEFAFLRNDVIRELSVPQSGATLGSEFVIPKIKMYDGTPLGRYTGHTITTSIDAPYKNWNLYLSYVYGQDSGFTMNYTLSGGTNCNFVAGNGIPFRVEDGGNSYILTSPVEHGMKQGEYIILSGGTLTSGITVNKKIFYIDSVGNQTYNSEKYVINLLKSEFTSGFTLNGLLLVLGKRCININDISGSTSTYYVHKHKTLTDNQKYIMDKVGFESTLFEEERKILYQNELFENDVLVERNRQESVLFDFKETFSLTGIKNNLNYTPTEIYVSIIFKNGNGLFNYPPKVGYKFNFHDTWIDKQFTGNTETSIGTTTITDNTSGCTFTAGIQTGLTIGTVLTGAFVEYNKKELKERIISETFHKFSHVKNTSNGFRLFNHQQDQGLFYSGASTGNTVGYYYQPHYRVKLRQLSPYIENSKLDSGQPQTFIDLPENAIFDETTKLWYWRDLYDHGFVDQEGNGTKFPFINDTHYVVNDINFYLRNEKSYTNKVDGLSSYNNYQNKTNC
jgi:hypothetical protein